jgi:hypothetical protein
VNSADVDLQLADGDGGKLLCITSGNSEVELLIPECSTDISLPADDIVWHKCDPLFLKGLLLSRFTVCDDQTAGALTGVRYYKEGDSILSCDRYRIFTHVCPPMPFESITVRAELIDQVSRFRDKIKEVGVFENHIYFRFDDGNTVIGSVNIPTEYPDNLFDVVSQLSTETDVAIIVTDEMRQALASSIDEHIVIQRDRMEIDKSTDVAIKANSMHLTSVVSGVGRAKSKVSLPETMPAKAVFKINPVFLAEAFNDVSQFFFNSENSTCVFKGDTFLHLVKTIGEDADHEGSSS